MTSIDITRTGGWTRAKASIELAPFFAQLREFYAFPVEGARYSQAFKDHLWDGKARLVRVVKKGLTASWPSGLDEEVLALIGKSKVSEIVNVDDARPDAPRDLGEWCGPELRDYQRMAAARVLSREGGIVRLPIRSGKTLTAAWIAYLARQRTLFVVTSDVLAEQAEQVFRAALPRALVGVYRGGGSAILAAAPLADIVIATIQALVPALGTRGFEKFSTSFGLVFCDECVPAGTMIGERPIEDIGVGDVVPAWDPISERIVAGTVIRTFKRPAPGRLMRLSVGNGDLICTEGHPVMTARGWIVAALVKPGDMVLCTIHGDPLRHLPEAGPPQEEQRSEGALHDGLVHLVRDPDHRPGMVEEAYLSLRGEGPSLLFRGVQAGLDEPRIVHQDGPDEPPICVGTDEAEKPDAEPDCAGKAEGDSPGHWASTDDARGQREAASSPPETAGRGSTLAYGGRCPDRKGEQERLSTGLQDRHRSPGPDDRHRDRWQHAQHPDPQGARLEEVRGLIWTRVDHVEIHEQTGDQQSRRLHSDGHVYNLEVEGVHTYIANGIVVHNCHHLGTGDEWRKVVLSLRAKIKVGLSATVQFWDRAQPSDLEDIWLRGVCGPVVASVEMEALFEAGHLLCPKVQIVHPAMDSLDLPEKTPWTKVYAAGIARNVIRNDLIATAAFTHRWAGVFVDCSQVGHARDIAMRIRATGAPVSLLLGDTDSETRQKAIQDFRRRLQPWEGSRRAGDPAILVGTILGEGVDIPELAVVINAEGGSGWIPTIQRLRNLTPSPGKQCPPLIIDFADTHHPILQRWSEQRMATYRAHGFLMEEGA